MYIALYAFKREILEKLLAAVEAPVTNRRQWLELDIGPEFNSVSPHNISKSEFLKKFAKKLVRTLK